MSQTENTIRKATIVGTGFYAPEKVVTNQFFNDMYKKDVDSFLREQRNIKERRWMSAEQVTSDLIVPAAEEAMKTAGISPKDLDLIIVSTDTPDYLSPSTASVVQFKIGAANADDEIGKLVPHGRAVCDRAAAEVPVGLLAQVGIADPQRAVDDPRGLFARHTYLLDKPKNPVRDVQRAVLGVLKVGVVLLALVQQAL